MKNNMVQMYDVDSLYNALTQRARTANQGITLEIVKDWVQDIGSVDRQVAFMTGALSALYSGFYTPDKMVQDILHTSGRDN